MFFEGCDMDIKKQFSLIAKEYDATRRKFIPCFDGFYETATKIILSNIKPPARVLDLGAGTGLLTYFWHKECPSAEYVLADISDEMLEVSKKRFAGLGNIKHIVMDYTKALPEGASTLLSRRFQSTTSRTKNIKKLRHSSLHLITPARTAHRSVGAEPARVAPAVAQRARRRLAAFHLGANLRDDALDLAHELAEPRKVTQP